MAKIIKKNDSILGGILSVTKQVSEAANK